MKLLVLTTRLFDRPRSGGEICTARLLGGLRAAGHTIVLAGRGHADDARGWADEVHSIGDVEPPFDEQPLTRRLRAVASALLSRESITVHRQGGRRVSERLAPLMAGCDAAVVDHLQAWPWLGDRPALPAMLVNHNVESDNYMRHSRAANRGFRGNRSTRPATRFLMRREAHRLRTLEFDALMKAASVACLTEADARRLHELAATTGHDVRARLVVLPGFPLADALQREPRPVDRRPRIGLIGTWTWAPNRLALRWLLEHVWPGLAGRAELVLAGGGLEGMNLPPHATVLGRVADVNDFYRAIDVIAVPSISGSGVQEKAIEALGTGLPVVATSHALRGLGAPLPACVRRADDATAFVQACLEASTPAVATLGARDAGDWAHARRTAYARALAEALQALRLDENPGAPLALAPHPIGS